MQKFSPGQQVTINEGRVARATAHITATEQAEVTRMLAAVRGHSPLYFINTFMPGYGVVSRDPDPTKALPDIATIVPLDLLEAVQ